MTQPPPIAHIWSMTSAKPNPNAIVAEQALRAFDELNGPHPGYRPAHAKGILLSGTFKPAAGAASLTKAPHARRSSTPISVRFSDSGGIPAIADTDPNASPRGIAIRFHLAEHIHTDIIGHSVNGFPARTGEEFVELLQAVRASGPGAGKPSPIEIFLASHPAALRFVQTPKPCPASFSTESYYAVSAYHFINESGARRFGRYQIHPQAAPEYLDPADAQARPADFLFDDFKARIAKGPVAMRIAVQLAADGDPVNDATVNWPGDRPLLDFGTIELTSVVPDNDAEQRHIIFDPIPRVDGIEPSDDPLLEVRASLYLMSGRRRRKEGAPQL